ncbi:DUF6238 family protein [Streptomyces sp. NPDC050095]|uniref:DUF6238 family protein n=1 Tax=unclassified Streptomyces TaxID=2593676 RepID=UPI0034365154
MPHSTHADPGSHHPYLRAATAGVRHHTSSLTLAPLPAERPQIDAVHAHLAALHLLLDRLHADTHLTWPSAGQQLAAARTRLWQAATAVHDAYHLLPRPAEPGGVGEDCRPERLPEGPPFLTICQRHLAASHTARRTTSPSDLASPLRTHHSSCTR